MTEINKKIIVYQNSNEPYQNKYSNTNKNNIIWGYLSDFGLSTDTLKKPIYYSPQFIKNKATDFILNHNNKQNWIVGKVIDVVYNNNGITTASGKNIKPDSRIWVCVEINKDKLENYNIDLSEI